MATVGGLVGGSMFSLRDHTLTRGTEGVVLQSMQERYHALNRFKGKLHDW